MARINDTKKRILNMFRTGSIKSALALFDETFDKNTIPDETFLARCYNELNKADKVAEGFNFISEASQWYPDNNSIAQLYKNAKSVYITSLIVTGNEVLVDRKKRADKFEEDLKNVGSLTKNRIIEGNNKVLTNMANEALGYFQKALELENKNLRALNGVMLSYQALNEYEKAQKYKVLVDERTKELYAIEKSKEELPVEETIPIVTELQVEDVEIDFFNDKFDEVIKTVDEIHQTHIISVPLLLLKASSYAKLRLFKRADQCIFDAERFNSHLKEIKELKAEIFEDKLEILNESAIAYLTKALELGPVLGVTYFEKSKECLVKAMKIFPENIHTLDNLYTVHKYLNEEKEALKIKALIKDLDCNFTPNFEKESESSICFLASFTYDGCNEKLSAFRYLRRKFLLSNAIGRRINCLYVKLSPSLVKAIIRMKIPPVVFRILLFPVYAFAIFLSRVLPS